MFKTRMKSIFGYALWAVVILTALWPHMSSAQVIKQQITDALTKGDTTLAIRILEEDIKLDPSYEYNYYLLGRIYEKQHKPRQAMEQYQISVDKKGKFFEGLYALGLVQLELGLLDGAEKNFRDGLKKSKDMEAEFHNGLGLLHMARGNLNEADKEIRQALLIKPENAEFHTNLGDVNFANKVFPLAISEYERALELDTASTDVYFRWADACLEMKDYNCALEKLRLVLTRDSTHADAWMKAGGIYYKAARSSRDPKEIKDRFIDAIGSYEKYLELSKAKPDSFTGRAYYETAMSYLMIGGYDKSRDYFRSVISIPVEPRDIYFYYGRSFQGGGDTTLLDSAILYYNKHIEWVKAQGEDYESSISNVELYRRLGECYETRKDYFNTITYFRKSLEYDSTDVRLMYGTAVAYNYTGDYVNALIYYMKRINAGVDERFWSIYYNAATSALYLMEKGGVSMNEEEDLGLGEDNPAPAANPLEGVDLARLAAGYLEKIANDHWVYVSSKEDYLKTGLRALNMLGSIYLYQLKDCTNAVKYYQKVLEYDAANAEAYKSLGYGYFSGICPSNYSRALEYLGKAAANLRKAGESECSPQMADIGLWIAQSYQFRAIEKREAKQKEEAKVDFKAAYDGYLQVLKCDPGNNAAKEGRDQVKYEY